MKNRWFAELLNSPLGLMAILGLIIAVVEFLIMLVILPNSIPETYWNLADPLLLILLVSPALYFSIFQKMRNLALYDTLTQLPNRHLLNDRMERIMAASNRSGRYGALIFLDLDNFKPLNDIHGHCVGDLLLIEAARRIALSVRKVDTVARFGGDEFVVVLSELDEDKTKSTLQASGIAEKIRATLNEPYVLKIQPDGKAETTIEHHCTSSIGVMLFIDHKASMEDIIKWADMAMYQVKEAGRNQILFYEPKD